MIQTSAGPRVPEIGELPATYARPLTPSMAIPALGAPAVAGLSSAGVNRQPTLAAAPPGSTGGPSTAWSRPSSASTSTDQPAAGFGYDPQYRWLKGKLEFSQATQSWRLRYIPPDGAGDNYGGSVVLSDASKLGGLKAGDLVYAEGAPGSTPASAGSFAPIYTLARIAKQ